MAERCKECKKLAFKAGLCEDHYHKYQAERNLTYVPLRDFHYTMVGKCTKENWKIYQYYGAKGFTVCKEWLNRDNFIAWALGQGYRFGAKIVLKQGEKEYSPNTCYIEKKGV